jgi:sensor histidine kinase YesM
MEQYPFIFSNERKYRLPRHLLFWFSWFSFSTILYSFSPINELNLPYIQKVGYSAIDAFFYTFAHIFLAYTLMYFVIPRFLLKRLYVKAAVATVILLFLTAFISACIGRFILFPIWSEIMPFRPAHENIKLFFNALLGGLRGAITIGGFAAAIKLMKWHYQKEQKNMELQKENIASQLQLLKAQVHPHFLFNTMNNIYSHTQVASPEAPRLVAGLSDMLRYMLYECNQPLVPLHKELKMLQDYIMLEKVRYNEGLDLSVVLPRDDEGLMIAPLLLLPLVENCFKHGTSQVIDHPWVSLTISISGNQMKMKLVNAKADNEKRTSHGIGIHNVRSRLELIYPGKHELRLSETEDAFIVSLNLELEKAVPTAVIEKPAVAYA